MFHEQSTRPWFGPQWHKNRESPIEQKGTKCGSLSFQSKLNQPSFFNMVFSRKRAESSFDKKKPTFPFGSN